MISKGERIKAFIEIMGEGRMPPRLLLEVCCICIPMPQFWDDWLGRYVWQKDALVNVWDWAPEHAEKACVINGLKGFPEDCSGEVKKAYAALESEKIRFPSYATLAELRTLQSVLAEMNDENMRTAVNRLVAIMSAFDEWGKRIRLVWWYEQVWPHREEHGYCV